MKSKQKKGISLIVLVITIIVMIIIAGAIILALNSSKVTEKASWAQLVSDRVNLQTELATIFSNIILNKKSADYVGVTVTDVTSTDEYQAWVTKVKNANERFSVYVPEDDNNPAGIKVVFELSNAEAEAFDLEYNELTGVISGYDWVTVETQTMAERLDELSVPVGATVKGYEIVVDSYTTSGEEHKGVKNGVVKEAIPQTITSNTSLTWKYIGIDENGKVLIAADSTGTLPKMEIGYQGAFLQGANELDKACSKLYSTDMGEARNMKIEDVLRLIKYSNDLYVYYDRDGKPIYSNEIHLISDLEKIYGEFPSTVKTPDTSTPMGAYYTSEIPIIPKTSQYITGGNIEKELVYQTTKYWLSSRSVQIKFSDNTGVFTLHCISNTNIGSYDAYYTSGATYCDSFAIRPVVVLKDSLKIDYDKTNNVINISVAK